MTEHARMDRTSPWIALFAVVALSACQRGETSERVEGRWVGTFGDDFQFIRGEFASTWKGQSGSLHLQGIGELTLVESRQIGDEILLKLRSGGEDVVFAAHLSRDAMSGYIDWPPGRTKFQLHRIAPTDRRQLAAYVGTYRLGSDWVRSIEDCASELGSDQLIYIDHRTGARKALFPISETTFFFGPGYLIPLPVEGTVTFLLGPNGRAQNLLWEQAGLTAAIAERADPGQEPQRMPMARRDSPLHCKPLPVANPRASFP